MNDHRACVDAASRVYPYLDGELGWMARVKVRWHLRSCTRCESAFIFQEYINARVHSGLGEECPDEVVDRLRGFLHGLE